MVPRAMKLGADNSKDDVKNLPDDLASYIALISPPSASFRLPTVVTLD